MNDRFITFQFILTAVFLCVFCGCLEANQRPKGQKIKMIATGYCPCEKCCGWKRNWFGRPVYARGKSKGKAKKIGICANGTKAKKGTVAADTSYYPFLTKMYIPGYGYGTVHDRGSDIKGPARIDLFFKTHKEAIAWGKKNVNVTVLEK